MGSGRMVVDMSKALTEDVVYSPETLKSQYMYAAVNLSSS
jgi:hypothetical protein